MEKVIGVVNYSAKSLTRTNYLGRDYLVAPVTLIRPGVLNGSQGPILYELDDMEESVDAWNGKPLLLGHPVGRSGMEPDIIESTGVGWVFNAAVRGKLVAEAWFDIEKTRRLNRELLTQIEARKPVEVSTGLVVSVEHGEGTDDRGRPYNRIARHYRPDHLAILVNQVGACSLNDGCGINNKESEKEMCTCNQSLAVANQNDLLGLPQYDFSDQAIGYSAGVAVANQITARDCGVAYNPHDPGQQDLLGLPPVMNFESPVKAVQRGNQQDDLLGLPSMQFVRDW